jgi:hypothetical protein
VERRLAAGSSRRPSTLRQDGRSRQQNTASREKRCRVGRLLAHVRRYASGARKAAATRKVSGKTERPEPTEGAGQGFVAQSCRHEVRFNGREGTRFDSSAQRRRRVDGSAGPTRAKARQRSAHVEWMWGRTLSAGHVCERELRHTWHGIHFRGEDAAAHVSATRAAGSE